MARPKKPKPPGAPNRTGVALNMHLPPELNRSMQELMDSLPMPTTKTAVVVRALGEYLSRVRDQKPVAKPGVPVVGSVEASPPTSVARPYVGDRYAELWFVGPIAAGTPLEIFDNPPERIDLAAEFGGEGRYVFVVRGDSMQDERIFDGDRVVIQRDPEPKSGDIVVARINNALTLKKLVATRGDEIRVVSCDGKSRNFVLQPDRGDAILGKFVAVYRKAK